MVDFLVSGGSGHPRPVLSMTQVSKSVPLSLSALCFGLTWPTGSRPEGNFPTAKPGRKNTESGAATFYCCRVVGPNLFTVFTVFYAHYAEDHLPKSNGRETIHLSDLSLSGFYDVIHT